MNGTRAFAIEARGLTKTYGSTNALAGLDLEVRSGSVHGLLGPNGAGKTTAVRLLSTLLRPDGGTAKVLGNDIVKEAEAVRDKISLTGQFSSIDEDLSGSENLVLFSKLLGFRGAQAKARAHELLDAFGLLDAANRSVKTYSGGMKRRLDLAASIIVTPELLFLDEPTVGLDPRRRNEIWSLIRSLSQRGTTVLLTTQYLDEADQLADQISVLDRGKAIAEGTPAQLKASVGAGVLHVQLSNAAQRREAEGLLAESLKSPVVAHADQAAFSAPVSDVSRVETALSRLTQNGIELLEFSFGQASLDEVFLKLTEHAAEPEHRRMEVR